MAITAISKDQVTLTVQGNVPKQFPNGRTTHLTLGPTQCLELYTDLKKIFEDGTMHGYGTNGTAADVP